MPRPKLRIAAGTGAIAAFLLIGGTAVPVVSADPGHSRDGNGSHRGGDSRGGDGDGRDGRGPSERGDDRRGGGPDRTNGGGGPDRTNGPGGPDRTNGIGGPDRTNDSGRMGEFDPDGTTGSQRTAATARSGGTATAAPSPSARTSSPGLATTATALPEVPAPVAEVGGGGGAVPVTVAPGGSALTAPRVTIGNGRTPGTLTLPPASPREAAGPVDVADPPVTPPAETLPLPPKDRLDVPPVQRAVASLWAAGEPNRPGGLLFGIAGLILAPLAGAWLGFRQARASRAAARLIRR